MRDCQGGSCSYYRYLQGTSMAAPHAVGVAALIVGSQGRRDASHGGLTLSQRTVERLLTRTAKQTLPDATDLHLPGPRPRSAL
ncbi:MAG TPA: S8 family serine peptidase [Actinomycetota bacterium]|nr:S8 family serine peptidase [Actinomycetota bacterium]